MNTFFHIISIKRAISLAFAFSQLTSSNGTRFCYTRATSCSRFHTLMQCSPFSCVVSGSWAYLHAGRIENTVYSSFCVFHGPNAFNYGLFHGFDISSFVRMFRWCWMVTHNVYQPQPLFGLRKKLHRRTEILWTEPYEMSNYSYFCWPNSIASQFSEHNVTYLECSRQFQLIFFFWRHDAINNDEKCTPHMDANDNNVTVAVSVCLFESVSTLHSTATKHTHNPNILV